MGVVMVVIPKVIGPCSIVWTREMANFKSSCNKNYLPWFSRLKFRDKICKSS
jgi:hypothetical protein